ncbi:MAG: hypothetical protein IJG31_05155 [Fusobacterium sp.]|nr:hypothetical protein [Fusobacterium sp.]
MYKKILESYLARQYTIKNETDLLFVTYLSVHHVADKSYDIRTKVLKSSTPAIRDCWSMLYEHRVYSLKRINNNNIENIYEVIERDLKYLKVALGNVSRVYEITKFSDDLDTDELYHMSHREKLNLEVLIREIEIDIHKLKSRV